MAQKYCTIWFQYESKQEYPMYINIYLFNKYLQMRKHLKNKRLESLVQLGTDRIIDLLFGTGEAAYHIVLELYDKGNIIITDFEWTILNVLRPHTEGDKVKFVVREKYPQNRARKNEMISKEDLKAILEKAKTGDPVKKVLVSNLGKCVFLLKKILIFCFNQI